MTMANTHELQERYSSGEVNRSPGEIHHDIEETRKGMDSTIDALYARLQPRQLLDDLWEYLRGAGTAEKGQQAVAQARRSGRTVLDHLRQNPVPVALCVTGVTWLLLNEGRQNRHDGPDEWEDLEEHSGSFVDARTGEPYDDDYGAQWKQEVPTWHARYDWKSTGEDENSWSERAGQSLADLKQTLEDSSRSAGERIRLAAARVVALSGHKRKEIRSRWRNLREHSGSFVDARTGEPYESEYGAEWRNLIAADNCAECEWSEEDERNWSEKASHALEEIQQSLAETGTDVKQRIRDLAARIGSFAGSTRDMMSEKSEAAWERADEWRQRQARGVRRTANRARQSAHRTGEQVRDGLAASGQKARETFDAAPLAVGFGLLAAGVLAGVLLPRTRREDEWFGETSNQLKDEVIDKGEEAVARGRQVAAATAESAIEEAERQGLTPGEMSESVEEAGSRIGRTAAEEVRQVGEEIGSKVTQVVDRARETASEETQHQVEELTDSSTSNEK